VTTRVGPAADTRPIIDLIRRGRGIKADIKSVRIGAAEAILKDFAGKSWPVRVLGRIQIEREIRALNRLRGLPGIPACFGRWGREGLLLERIEGERITRFCERQPASAAVMFERLERLVAAMHARGVVHLDLRKRDNILIDGSGRPGIIDFNAAVRLTGASRRALWLLRRIDTEALVKWKERMAPGLLQPGEARRRRRMAALRRLWIFS
jgi:RIO-like serine/threonine protein kinase